MPKDNSQELFYLVDENDEVIGSVTRKIAHSDKSKIHRAIDIIIFNDQGQILLQKRSLTKDTNPGLWTNAAGGHVEYGKEYAETAQRELQEEIGLNIPLEQIGKVFVTMPVETEFIAVFKGLTNLTPTKLDPDEVSEVRWFTLNEIKDLRANNLLSHGVIPVFEFLKLF